MLTYCLMIRSFALATIVIIACCGSAFSQTFTQRIEALQLHDGHLPRAYLHNDKASGLVWYFSTIGVQAIAFDGNHDTPVRDYLDRYLATATRPGGAINDVQNLKTDIIEWKLSDSDDSYAAGVLSLACWYSHRKDGASWFNANLKQLKFIATANLVDAIDPKYNLTCTFNKSEFRFTEPLVVGRWNRTHGKDQKAKTDYREVCQLMDNCEAYRGLKDFADRLAELGDAEAETFATASKTLAQGILAMFDPATQSFRVSTIPSGSTLFYPHRVIQVAPEIYGVDLGPDTQVLYRHAWKYLNAGGDRWWQGEIKDGSNDGSPMMILAFAAACHGDTQKAADHLNQYQRLLTSRTARPEVGNIEELGWALRAKLKLR
jgi:hypothetical protein